MQLITAFSLADVAPEELRLELDGATLPVSESIDLLRDGDIVRVSR